MQTELEISLKQFDMLHSLLSELQKKFMSGTAAATGFILLGIGWFASAADSAPVLKQFPHFLWVVALAPVLGAALYCYGAWLVHQQSQNTAAALGQLDDMPGEIYESRVVSRNQFFIFSAGVVLLSMILGGCIYCAGKAAPEKDDNSDEDETILQVSLPHTRIQLLVDHPQHQNM